MSAIEKITGKNNIIVVAPRGVNDDGENTDLLARLIAEKIECHAFINSKCRKPQKDEKPSKKDYLVDLDDYDQVNEHLGEEFLLPYLALAKELVEKHGKAVIFWLFGMDDENVKNEIDNNRAKEGTKVFIGIGQNETQAPKPTAKKNYADWLIDLLENDKDFPLTACLADEKSEYCGNKKSNMIQVHTKRKAHNLDTVETFQLELAYTGCRDEDSIEKTANSLANAFKTVSAGALTVVEADNKLVDEAYLTLNEIMSKHFEGAIIEAGEYLVKTFYDDDIELARKKKSKKHETLKTLIEKYSDERTYGNPSKSWIYNAVNLVVQRHDLKGVEDYDKLKLSHKVLLLNFASLKTKRELIQDITGNKYTIAQLKKRVDDEKLSGNTTFQLGFVIKDPESLTSEKIADKLTVSELEKYGVHKLKALHKSLLKKSTEIEKVIEDFNAKIAQQQFYLEKYKALEPVFIEAQKVAEKNKKPKGRKKNPK